MNDVIESTTARDASLRTIGHVSYALHTIVAVTAVLPGAQASVVKRGDAAGTWQESHFSWRIRSVVWAGILYLVTAPLWLLLVVPGWIAWTLVSIWFLYRIVKGMVRMNGNQPMDVAGAV